MAKLYSGILSYQLNNNVVWDSPFMHPHHPLRISKKKKGYWMDELKELQDQKHVETALGVFSKYGSIVNATFHDRTIINLNCNTK